MLKTLGLVAASAALATGAGATVAPATTAAPSAAPKTVSAPAHVAHPKAATPANESAPAKATHPQGKAGDIVMPPMPTPSTGTSGTVNFQLTNNTSQTVTFNVNVSPDAQRETNLYSFESGIFSANPQVAPGQTVVIPVVAGGQGLTDSSDPLVTVGLEGYAQFEMWVHVNTWTNSNFQNIEYKGNQTGGGNTGGLSQINLGNGSVISNGNAGINNDWTYVNGTSAGFWAN